MAPRLCRALIPVLCVVVAGCGGSDSGGVSTSSGPDGDNSGPIGMSPGTPTEAPPVFVTDETPESGELGLPEGFEPSLVAPDTVDANLPPASGLRVAATTLCPTVGESFEVSVNAVPPAAADGEVGDPFDVTASITLTQSLGDGLELLSQGDAAIALQMTTADIVALRADFPESSGPEGLMDRPSGQTVYVGGFPADAPADVLMRKLIPGGCLLALRLPSREFCGTAISRGGTASLGSGGTIVSIDNCDIDGPDTLPVVELAADSLSRGAF